jgi:hypothetical protein
MVELEILIKFIYLVIKYKKFKNQLRKKSLRKLKDKINLIIEHELKTTFSQIKVKLQYLGCHKIFILNSRLPIIINCSISNNMFSLQLH